MRVLVVTNIYPTETAPHRGAFVRDQVEALRAEDIELELFRFEPGRQNYRPAIREMRSLLRDNSFDLVHAHYGLVGWCARRAGAEPLVVTFHGTDVRHRLVGPLSRRLARRIDLIAAASLALFAPEAGRPGLPRKPGATSVLPCGLDVERFRPLPRAEARQRLGLNPEGRYLLFPADPARPVKRADRASELAALTGSELLSGGAIPYQEMPSWVNAANAVIVPSENEGFGLATLEALACDVPVLSTPVGVAGFALRGIEGCLASPYDPDRWADALRPHLDAPDPRVSGRPRAEAFSSTRMARRVIAAYEDLLT